MKNRARKKKQNDKDDRLISILTFVSLGAIIWEISLFRKTFINLSIPLTLFIGGGLILFLLFKNRIRYYVENSYGFFLQAFHGVILFGGLLMFLFMALNFYIPTGKIELVDFKVIKTGTLSKGRHGGGNPYAVVDYHGFEKQLIFSSSSNLDNAERIKVHLQKGLFGFLIVKDKKLVNPVNPEETKQYMNILVRADEYYSDGNSQKAIELYERAIRLNPSDKLAKIRLKEMKSAAKMTEQKDNYVKILFRFHSDVLDKEMVETMWATIIDKDKGFYKLDNIPFYAPLVASDDIVFAEFDKQEQLLTYRKTVKHSGNSTVQIVLMDKAKNINSIRDLFEDLGCISEKMNEGYFSMEVPASVDYKKIKQKLEALEATGTIGYAEPCLAEGHRK